MNPLISGNLKSKTSWFSVLLILFGTLNDSTELLKQILPIAHIGAVLAGVGLITLVLRNITTQAISDKGSDKTESTNATPPTP